MRNFWQWQAHRHDKLPEEEAAWEQSFGIISDNLLAVMERTRKTWAFRVRYWFKRKFVWRA